MSQNLTMEQQPAISVILPVYKAEPYLERCLRSLAAQTLGGVEYLFVDDASPDRSAAIIADFFHNNPLDGSVYRIITNPKNSGVGFSRQNGLDHAVGKYIIHVDPDDRIEPDYLEKLYKAAEAVRADITFCDIFIEYSDRTVRSRQCPDADDSYGLTGEFCRGAIMSSCWNKLVRRSAIEKSNAHFLPGVNVCEDLLFFLQLCRTDLRIAKVSEPLYHYDRFTNSHSIQRHLLPDHLAQDNRLIEAVGNILSHKRYESFRGDFISSALFHIFEISGYSNAEFRRRYSQYAKYVAANPTFSKAKKSILLLSCKGFYRPARALYSALQRLRRVKQE